MCLDERARVARVVRVWERALLTLKIALHFTWGGSRVRFKISDLIHHRVYLGGSSSRDFTIHALHTRPI